MKRKEYWEPEIELVKLSKLSILTESGSVEDPTIITDPNEGPAIVIP